MWRTYFIRPVNARGGVEMSKEFYAPNLDTAFALARIEWPCASSWECMGSRA